MADIEERKNADNTVTYRVRWRQDGKRPAYTFNTAPHKLGDRAATIAERFRDLVTTNGDRLPSRDQLAAFGLAWILSAPTQPPAIPTQRPAPADTMTVTQMLGAYVDYLEAKTVNNPEPGTLRQYRSNLRVQIEPRPFGRLDQGTCQSEDVETWQHECLTTVSPKGRKVIGDNTIRTIRDGLLTPAFTWACSVRSGQLRTLPSPMIDAEAPRKQASDPHDILQSPEEVAIFLQAAWERDRNHACMLAVEAATGLRWEEITALPPHHVIPARNVVRVRQRNIRGQILQRTKNKGVRDVPVPPWMMRTIIMPRLSSRHDTVFRGPTGQKWAYSTDQHRWIDIRAGMAAAGLPLHLTSHCLRHTAATWLKSHDMHPQKIDLLLGHRDSRVSSRYNQLTARDYDQMRDIMTTLIPPSSWPGDVIE